MSNVSRLAIAIALAGASGLAYADGSVNVYSARHYDSDQAMYDAFGKGGVNAFVEGGAFIIHNGIGLPQATAATLLTVGGQGEALHVSAVRDGDHDIVLGDQFAKIVFPDFGILEAGQVGCRIGSRRGLNIEDEDILVPHGQGVPRVLYTGESLFPDPGVISVPGRWRTSP